MKTIIISGTQGAGKSIMAREFARVRGGTSLEIDASELRDDKSIMKLRGRKFDTIVVDDVTDETDYDLRHATARLALDGVLVLVKEGGR
jgi:nicotinamide riboside kinase